MDSLVLPSPAKINLMLAVTGRRVDGFHDLVSVVAPVAFGDTLRLERQTGRGAIHLTCDHATLSTGPDNLVVRAADAFRRAVGCEDGIAITLTKRIPLGAGLGGGSSNAAAVLRGLNMLWREPLSPAQLVTLAATLGSDCPLFLARDVCVIRGRGERIARLAPAVRSRISGARVLVFKPDFGVATPWAYAQLAASPYNYLAAETAESRLAAWCESTADLADLLFNSFESVVFRKFLALPTLAAILREQPGVAGVLLSGSGSACFAVLSPAADVIKLQEIIHTRLGPEAFVMATSID